jgi:RNA polymerase sigma-70 factor (ECF subfamily)
MQYKDLFQEVMIQLWKAFPKFRGDSKSFLLGSCSAKHGHYPYRKNKRTIATVEYEGRQHFIKDVEYMRRSNKLNSLSYQLNDIEKVFIPLSVSLRINIIEK